MPEPLRVLFVCLGNICRSPAACAAVCACAERRGLSPRFTFASAGTGDWQIGKPADLRMQQAAAAFGLDLSRHRARQIKSSEINDWDWFVAMDGSNRAGLIEMGVLPQRIVPMLSGDDGKAVDVPDPYTAGEALFPQVMKMIADHADALLDRLLVRGTLPGRCRSDG